MKPFFGTVLVAGATGRTGAWVVKRLQHYALDYRLFVRSGEKALELFGAEVIDKLTIGSIENPDDIHAAVHHADALICAIGGNAGDPTAPPPSAIDRDGVIRLAQIAKAEGVRHFILISSLAVTRPDHPLNKYGQVLTMKLAGEDEVRRLFSDEGCCYTIIRPGGLLDGAPFQHALISGTGDQITTGVIQRSDVAEMAVLSLTNGDAVNCTFEIIQAQEEPQQSLELYFPKLKD